MANTSKELPDYTSPPLTEVACGISFTSLSKMNMPHFGLFWNLLIDDFPVSKHAPPLGGTNASVCPSTGLPLPRIWLIGESENILIQLQNDRFLFNWRKMGDTDEYPRFNFVLDSFRKYLGVFINFVGEYDLGEITPIGCELNYINHIVEGEGWQGTEQIGNIFNDIAWSSDKEFLPPPSVINWQGIFELPEDKGELDVILRQGKRRTDMQRLFTLEMNAKGIDRKMQQFDDVWSWYDLAHEWIVKGFADLTKQEIQANLWGRK